MAKITGATHHVGKGSAEEMLPHRAALTTLAGGNPLARTMNQYAKATPSGAGALAAPSVLGLSPPGNSGVNG